jgi:hypothetical protein
MDKKIKFIIIGLGGVLFIIIFMYLQALMAKQALERQKTKLIAENTSLAQKAEESLRNVKRLDERLGAVNRDLEKALQEKEEFQKKVDLLTKEKEELAEKLKTKKEEPVITREEPKPTVTEDTYWAGVLKAKTDLELQVSDLREELKNMQINYEQLQREKGLLDLDAKNLNREKQDLQRQLEYNQKMFDNAFKELVTEKNDKKQIQDVLKSLKSENAILRRQLRSISTRKMDLERKISDLQKENTTFKDRFTQMDTLLRDRTLEMENLREELESGLTRQTENKESVELPAIVVRPSQISGKVGPPQQAQTAPLLSGKILAINKENKFVIIDLGQDHGVKIGDTFGVSRADKPIANIEVIQTRKEISACDIRSETAPINVGDIVQ